jgi:hypothetical protein
LVRIVSKKSTHGGNDLVPFGGENGRRIRGTGGRDWRRRRGKELENLSSLRESHPLVKLGEDFQVERDDRVRAGYLQHRVDIVWGDEE